MERRGGFVIGWLCQYTGDSFFGGMVEHLASTGDAKQIRRAVYAGGNAVAAINNDAGVFILFLDRVIVAGAKYLTGKGRHLGGTNGGGKIMEGVMETLRMGGYGGYVWGVYLLAILVLWSNLALARRQKKMALKKVRARRKDKNKR